MKKTSIYLELILKSLEFFEKASHHFKKASIPFQSLVIFVKASEASISLKMSSKSLVVFIKASHL
jgi:hypothetical protein